VTGLCHNRTQKKLMSPLEHLQARCGMPLHAIDGTRVMTNRVRNSSVILCLTGECGNAPSYHHRFLEA
jgi:hypothetical protein